MSDIPIIKDPIPSNKMQVLDANTKIIDAFTNSKEDYTHDRFGEEFKTRYKILADLQQAVEDISSGAGFLPITGGKVNGEITANGLKSLAYVSSENDQNSDLRLLTQTGKNGYFIRRFENDLYIYNAENGVATDKIAQYIKSTDTWDFNTLGLTKNEVPVATTDDLPKSIVLYPGGTEENPAAITTGEIIEIVNPFKTMNVELIIEVLDEDEITWGDITNSFVSSGIEAATGFGVLATCKGEKTIQIMASNRGVLGPKTMCCHPLSYTDIQTSLKYRVRAIRIA